MDSRAGPTKRDPEIAQLGLSPRPENWETDGLSPRPNKLGPRYVSRPTHPKNKRLVEMTSRLFLVPLVGLEPTLCRF